MLSMHSIKVSDDDYRNIACTYQWQVQSAHGNLQLDVAVFHFKNSKFVLEFNNGNVENLSLPDKKICVIDVEDQIHHVKVKYCAGRGDNGQKRFVTKKPFNHAIKTMRFQIQM